MVFDKSSQFCSFLNGAAVIKTPIDLILNVIGKEIDGTPATIRANRILNVKILRELCCHQQIEKKQPSRIETKS